MLGRPTTEAWLDGPRDFVLRHCDILDAFHFMPSGSQHHFASGVGQTTQRFDVRHRCAATSEALPTLVQAVLQPRCSSLGLVLATIPGRQPVQQISTTTMCFPATLSPEAEISQPALLPSTRPLTGHGRPRHRPDALRIVYAWCLLLYWRP